MRKTIHTENENPVIERITELLIKTGKTQKELTDFLGLGKTAYSDWKSGKTDSYILHIEKIVEFLGSTYDYILHGKMEDPQESELIRLYRNLNGDKKERLLALAQTI